MDYRILYRFKRLAARPSSYYKIIFLNPYDFILRPLRLTHSWTESKGNNIFSPHIIFYLTLAILDKRVYVT